MNKSKILWGIPLAILLLLSGVLSIINDFDYYILTTEVSKRIFWSSFGYLYLIAGLYGLIYIFIVDGSFFLGENDNKVTFKEFAFIFFFVAVPALLLCFIGYYALTTSVGDFEFVSLIEQYDVLSYIQLVFAIICFLLFWNSYPRTKPKNWLYLVIAILALASGFMKVMLFIDMILYYLSYVVYAIAIGLLVLRTFIDAKDSDEY